MGAKAAKLKDRDVPAHNPLITPERYPKIDFRMHYFKDREESKETQIRQESHFTIINKNGVVDDGKTLVGLKKRNHMGKIYFIRRLPKKYGGKVEEDSQDFSERSSVKDEKSHSEQNFDEQSHQMLESQYVGEDERMIDNNLRSEESIDSDFNNLNNTNEDDGKIMLSDRKLEEKPINKRIQFKEPVQEDSEEDIETPQKEHDHQKEFNDSDDIHEEFKKQHEHPIEENKEDFDDSSSEEEVNEIPAIVNPPSKEPDMFDMAPIARDESESSEGNEIEAVADEPVKKQEPPRKTIEEMDSSSSDGNEIEAVANSPVPSDKEEEFVPPMKKKKSKKKKRIRPNEFDSDDD